MIRDAASAILVLGGLAFFTAATAGLLRFPDALGRLHAVAKADNVGLGLVVFGLVVRSTSIAQTAKLLAIWVLALIAGAATSQLIGRYAYRSDRS